MNKILWNRVRYQNSTLLIPKNSNAYRGFTLGLLLIFSLTSMAQVARQVISKDVLMPLMRLAPCPSSGVIDVNSPWFYWSPVVKKKSGNNTYEFDSNYLYQGRVSQDSMFQGPSTIVSDLREWCMFNPHKKLKKGTWYWQYSSVNKLSGEQTWSAPISFIVSGDEREFVIPSFEQVKHNIGVKHPRIYCSPEQIGTFDLSLDGLKGFLDKTELMLDAALPTSLLFSDQKVLSEKKQALKPKDYKRFLGKRTKEIYRTEARFFDDIIKAWLLTGNQVYQKEALRRYSYLKNQYEKIVAAGAYNDFTEGFYINVSTQTFDVFYDTLNPKDKQEIMDFLITKQEESYHHILHNGEHFSIDNHLWQHHYRHFFTTSLALINHTPKADKWAKYIYEVWSMRAPVGSRNDGGWVPDNGYFDANKESLITFPVILSRLTGVDYFKQPWYQNSPVYMFYTSPIGHVAGGFGDLADVKSENNLNYVRALSAITDNQYGQLYSNMASDTSRKTHHTLASLSLAKDGNLFWYAMQAKSAKKNHNGNVKPERAKCFPDVGMVAMHTNILEPRTNVMLSFRSSPFGLTGHAHAAQNAFNIQYGGEPLFFKTGYYSSFIDPHSILSYRHTRAHNSILADGIGQVMTPSGYGWIARFGTGQKLSYALGDASNAYSGQLLRDYYVEQFDKWKINISKENGFGHPGVTVFRRHICMLENNIIVIYDELEAEKPVDWSWLIHSRGKLDGKNQSFYTENDKGKGVCHLFQIQNLQCAVRDTFFSTANDWLGNGAKRGIKFSNHSHGIGSTSKCNKARFLAIIELQPKHRDFDEPKRSKDGTILINNWHIKAELDPNKPTTILIQKDGVGCISLGDKPVVFNGTKYNHRISGSTLFIEKENKGVHVKEIIDQLPDAAIYY